VCEAIAVLDYIRSRDPQATRVRIHTKKNKTVVSYYLNKEKVVREFAFTDRSFDPELEALEDPAEGD